ncbi:MAG: sulfurtransferase [Burkholderiales bacterium]
MKHSPALNAHARARPAASPLVSATALKSALDGGADIVLLDASFDLSDLDAGRRAFAQGQVPGAQHADLDRDLSGPKAAPGPGFTGRHPLPARDAFAVTAGRWGIGPTSCVVAMDAQGSAYAARLWWLLRWLGHSRVWVLDGGIDAWREAGGTLTTEPTPPRPRAAYPRKASSMPTIDATGLARVLGVAQVIDARAPERFRGDVEPLDPVAGHIPGTRNRSFKDNLEPDSARFKPAAQLTREFAALNGRHPPAETFHLCGSGVTACHNLLAMEAAGLPGATLYPGSWSEWCADPARPIARGG